MEELARSGVTAVAVARNATPPAATSAAVAISEAVELEDAVPPDKKQGVPVVLATIYISEPSPVAVVLLDRVSQYQVTPPSMLAMALPLPPVPTIVLLSVAAIKLGEYADDVPGALLLILRTVHVVKSVLVAT